MVTRTEAANAACTKLGLARIVNSLDESEQGRTINTVFDRIARSELRRQAWSFALKRAALPALVAAPAFGWQRSFQMPIDLLRLVFVGDYYVFPSTREGTNAPDPQFLIEGREILTNDGAPLRIRYVRDLSQNPEVWDACFFEAFACKLAYELVPSTTKKTSDSDRLRADYKMALLEAKRCNALELPPQPVADDSWILSRYT